MNIYLPHHYNLNFNKTTPFIHDYEVSCPQNGPI
jgi:hypothetical protein